MAEVFAVLRNGAAVAEWARLADAAAMQDQRVGCASPVGGRKGGAQLLFDDDRVVGARDADAIGDAEDVAIDGEAGDAERVPEHDVRGLAADARQLDERLHRPRHLSAMVGHQRGGHAFQRSRLGAEKARGLDLRLEL